jgi:hypothetical protein
MTSQSEKTKHACIDISIKHKLMYIVIHKQSYIKLNHELVIAELPVKVDLPIESRKSHRYSTTGPCLVPLNASPTSLIAINKCFINNIYTNVQYVYIVIWTCIVAIPAKQKKM